MCQIKSAFNELLLLHTYTFTVEVYTESVHGAYACTLKLWADSLFNQKDSTRLGQPVNGSSVRAIVNRWHL